MAGAAPALSACLSCVLACSLVAFLCQRLPTVAGSDGMACYVKGARVPNGTRWNPTHIPQAYAGRVRSPRCLVCSCINGEVECGDVQSLCPPTPCPLELRVQPRWTCCAFCSRPGFDLSSGSGSPPVEVYKDCWDELGNLRRHGQCWNITYLGQATCMGACCRDGETSIAPPPCRPVPACRPGQQPYRSALECCKQCSVTVGAPRPSPRPSTDVKVQATLKECVGKRPYRIYMADPEKMDAFAYSIVNRDQVHVLQWNLTGIHSLKMSRATFAALPQRPFYLYMGRSTSETVSDLVSNLTKVQRVASCHKSCAQLIVTMLEPSMQPMRLEDC